MREASGSLAGFPIILTFIFIFSGYILLTISYSRVIKTKNEVISMIEKYQGLNEQSIKLVNGYLTSSNYNGRGACGESGKNIKGIYGSKDLTSNKLVKADGSKDYYYCVRKYNGIGPTSFYQVTLFFKFELPVLGDFSSFLVKGSTSSFQSRDETDYKYSYGT